MGGVTMKVWTQLKKHFAIGLAMLAIVGGSLFIAEDALALRDYWCPSCSSDFCQDGGGEFLMIVGGECYCCVGLD